MTDPTTRYHHTLSPEQQERFADIYLLRRMINGPLAFSIDLSGDNSFLEQNLNRMVGKGWVAIDTKNARYVPTEAGREPLQKFEQRYYDYLRTLDVPYNTVDLAYGDFGYTYVESFDTKQSMFELLREDRWRPFLGVLQEFITARSWNQEIRDAAFRTFLNLEPWEDLRIAVAEFKQLDPLEIVFMSLLNEGHFDHPKQSWQFDLHAGWFFRDVEQRANNALHLDQLYAEGCTAEEIMQSVIIAGTDLMMQLIAHQDALEEVQRLAQTQGETSQAPTVSTTTGVIEEVSYVTVVEPVYYTRSYYGVYLTDPFYIAPIWYDPWYW